MNRYQLTLLIGLVFLCVTGMANRSTAQTEKPLNLFVAASLTDLASEFSRVFADQSGIDVRVVPEATSTLARQIAAGAPADILLSANRDWVDWLISRNPELAGASHVFAGNGLALVSGDETLSGDLRRLLGPGERARIAIADPEHVPAGQYAKQALTAAGLWDNIAGRLVPAANVRDALRLAQTGQTPYAIVYESDAAASGVSIVAPLPEPEPAISYFALPIKAGPKIEAFMDFLRSPEAEDLLCRYGFRLPEGRPC